jgi:hypothetical protein
MRLPKSRGWLGLWALLAALVIFGPSLYTMAWHLSHGGMVAYRGKRVPVPLGWTADPEPQGLTLTKLPVTLLTLLELEWVSHRISISRLPPLRDQTVGEAEESFERIFWTYAPASDDAAVSGPIRLGASPHDIFCMKTLSRRYGVQLNCLVEQASWVALFNGQERDEKTFYAVIGSMN